MADNITQIFDNMPAKYRTGVLSAPKSFYFSIGDHKYTVKLSADSCDVEKGKTLDNCDVVLKTTPKLFENMVIKGKMPGAFDIARGKIKTNDVSGLKGLKDLFDFSR